MARSRDQFQCSQARKDSFLGGVMQRQIFNSDHGLPGKIASRFGAILAMAGLLLLSACDGGGSAVTENNLTDPPFKDGVPPTLTSVSIRESTKSAKPNGTVETGKSVRIDITASEALMKPLVTINGADADVTGKVNGWYAVRQMTEADSLGEVYFSIIYEDISGEKGESVSETTDGSAVVYCGDDCPEPVDSLAGDWRLDGVGSAGVGPAPGDVSWWSADEASLTIRDCWFDDIYRLGEDGSFNQILGDATWLEEFQGVDPAGECGAPVAPHDGSTTGTFEYNEIAGELTITGTGLHLGLAKVVNGEQLSDPLNAPASIIYQVLILDGDTMTVTIEANPDEWWTFRIVREPVSPLAGKWKLDGEGAAGVGPAEGDVSWWAADAGAVDIRACWFDDVYEFGADGSFRNTLGDETWLEEFQGAPAEGACGAPVAPHDGSNGAIYQYDEDAGTLKLTGVGAHIGLPRTMNDVYLATPEEAPESVTYNVILQDGDNLTVTIQSGLGDWWQYKLVRVSNSPLVGNWKLDGEGAAGVGPNEGDVSWWAADAGAVETRACWFDDVHHFGADGSFQNFQDGDTWLEEFQGAPAEGACGAPIAPHDGSTRGAFQYDPDAGTLTLTGVGTHIGLPRTMNDVYLTAPSQAPESVIYNVTGLDAGVLTVTIQSGLGDWWQYRLRRVPDNAAVKGKWKLDGEGAAGVGPAEGDVSWWAADAGAVDIRSCWFDDVYEFGADGSFQNVLGDETWLEEFQGAPAEGACGGPVAPHDGSNGAIYEYDADVSTLKLTGVGAHIGLPRTMNDVYLSLPSEAPESVTYNVAVLDGDNLTVTIQSGLGDWWQYKLVRVSNSPLVGNWKLDGEGAAGVGPNEGDVSWWAADAGAVETRACWFDDVHHFGADGSFQNFQDGDTWLEEFQGAPAEGACGAPIAPHDGSTRGAFQYDPDAGTLTLTGVGTHIGLPRTMNDVYLTAPSQAPESVIYNVTGLDAGILTVTIQSGLGDWWQYKLAKE